MLQLFRSGEKRGLNILVKNNASFKYAPCGNTVHGVFRQTGPSPRLNFLIENGASLRDVPCGLGQLREDTYHEFGHGPRYNLLFNMLL